MKNKLSAFLRHTLSLSVVVESGTLQAGPAACGAVLGLLWRPHSWGSESLRYGGSENPTLCKLHLKDHLHGQIRTTGSSEMSTCSLQILGKEPWEVTRCGSGPIPRRGLLQPVEGRQVFLLKTSSSACKFNPASRDAAIQASPSH